MHIGVDACCWANGRGYGRFTRELLSAMVALSPEDRFTFILDRRAAEMFELSAPNARVRIVELGAAPTVAASAAGNRSPLDMLRLSRAAWKEDLDVFFCPSVYSFFPLPPGLKAVVAIHGRDSHGLGFIRRGDLPASHGPDGTDPGGRGSASRSEEVMMPRYLELIDGAAGRIPTGACSRAEPSPKIPTAAPGTVGGAVASRPE